MILALGILAAVFERGRSGQGQVVDAAMIDGAALLGACFFGYTADRCVEHGAGDEHRGLRRPVLRRL